MSPIIAAEIARNKNEIPTQLKPIDPRALAVGDGDYVGIFLRPFATKRKSQLGDDDTEGEGCITFPRLVTIPPRFADSVAQAFTLGHHRALDKKETLKRDHRF
jgi:hypothetical protein